MTIRPNGVENSTAKIDNDKEVRRSEYMHEHANVLKLRSEVERIDGALREIGKTRVTVSTLVLPSTHEREYLKFIFSSTTRFADSLLAAGGRWQLCYRRAARAREGWDLSRFNFSNIPPHLTQANRPVLIQGWAKSNASCSASAEGSSDKP